MKWRKAERRERRARAIGAHRVVRLSPFFGRLAPGLALGLLCFASNLFAQSDGGVAYSDSATFTVNTLGVSEGGVVYADSATFTVNTLGAPSGAVAYSDSGTFTVNTLGAADGAVAYADSGTFTVNTLGAPSGTVAYSDSGTFTVNTLGAADGAVAYSDSGTFTVNTLGAPSGTVAYSDSGTFTINTLGVSAGAVVWSDSANFLVVTAVSPYNGNGDTSFGGAVGTGTLILSNNVTTVFGTITRNTGNFTNVLVIYLDTGAGGFADTSGFNDAGSALRKAISGIDGSGDRSLLTFTGASVPFAPAFALALSPATVGIGSLWQLAAGGNNSLNFVTNVNLTPVGTGTAPSYSFQFDFSQIGLKPATNAESFKLMGTCISTNGYRSSEALPGNLTGYVGWNPYAATAYGVYYTLPAVMQTPGAPPLYISHSGDVVTVYWQDVSGWNLQQNTNLLNHAGWSINSNWTTSNGTNSLILTAPTGNLFFRLSNP
jgi:hypothetical protein